MSDLSTSKDPGEAPEPGASAPSLWLSLKKLGSRLSDWYAIQTTAVQMMVIAVAILIPVTGTYSFVVWQRQAAVAEQVQAMAGQSGSDALWTLNEKLPWCSAPARCWASSKPARWTGSR
jgi:cell division protease FtsH